MPQENLSDMVTESNIDIPTSNHLANGKQTFLLSIWGLILGVIAIGLASIPAIALDRSIFNPLGERQNERPVAEPLAQREGGMTLKSKDISVNFGGKPPEQEPEAVANAMDSLTADPIRWFTVSAICCALLGLVVSSLGHIREKHLPITIVAMSCCAAAITWQFLAIGIAIGVAAAVFLVVFGAIGSAGGG